MASYVREQIIKVHSNEDTLLMDHPGRAQIRGYLKSSILIENVHIRLLHTIGQCSYFICM